MTIDTLAPEDFVAFHRSLHGCDPSEWLLRVCEDACEDRWPHQVDVPHCSSRLRCIDAALFALAIRGGNAARRIYVVHRLPSLLDSVSQYAMRLAAALDQPRDSTVAAVASALRVIAGADLDPDAVALACASAGGGPLRTPHWCRSPLQPTVVSTDVRQFGSELLFRADDAGSEWWPLHAGLAGCGSLILGLDLPDHLPFHSTIATVHRSQMSSGEASEHLRPLRFISVRTDFESAAATCTPAADARPATARPTDNGAVTVRVAITPPSQAFASQQEARLDTPGHDLVHQTRLLLSRGIARLLVVVSEEQRAIAVASSLSRQLGRGAKLILVAGSTRGVELARHRSAIAESTTKTGSPAQPLLVVATDAIAQEDALPFDGVVTDSEAAVPLLHRLSGLGPASGGPLRGAWIRASPFDGWRDRSTKTHSRRGDPGPGGERPDEVDRWHECLADRCHHLRVEPPATPRPPTLLPAHLAMLARTSPSPAVEPELSRFIDGVRDHRGAVKICWRADLPGIDAPLATVDRYLEMLPPTSAELGHVSREDARAWLAETFDRSDPALSGPSPRPQRIPPPPRILRVFDLGRGHRWIRSTYELQAGDILMVADPMRGSMPRFMRAGPLACSFDSRHSMLDCADDAWLLDRLAHRIRLTPPLLRAYSRIAELPDRWMYDVLNAVDVPALGSWQCSPALLHHLQLLTLSRLTRRLPASLRRAVDAFRGERHRDTALRVRAHPCGGSIIEIADDHAADLDAAGGHSAAWTSLAEHSREVAVLVRHFAKKLRLSSATTVALVDAARWHDVGKADPRYQQMLLGGLVAKEPIAWASHRMEFSGHRTPDSGDIWPRTGRPEMLAAVAFLAAGDDASRDSDTADLAAHLIASHGGGCRPFMDGFVMPMERFALTIDGQVLSVVPGRTLAPDAGVAVRFARLTDRYGAWGLCSLESILRIADATIVARECHARRRIVQKGAMRV